MSMRMFEGWYNRRARPVLSGETGEGWQEVPAINDKFAASEHPGWLPIQQQPWEFGELVRLYVEHAPRRTLEIGTGYGGSLWWWIQKAREGSRIASVDLKDIGDSSRIFLPDSDKVRVRVVKGDSHSPAVQSEVLQFLGGGIDWLFIDGDHSYEGVLADFNDYGVSVAAGGIIALHDIYLRQEGDVPRAWQEIRQAGFRTQELVIDPDLPSDSGIGVVYL